MPLIIGIAVVIAFGAMAGIVYTLLHHNEAIVVEPQEVEQPTDEAPPAQFDGKLTVMQVPNTDMIQLGEAQKSLLCRVEYSGKLVDAPPPALLTSPAADSNPEHSESKSVAVPVDLLPSNISCAQAAPALFEKIFGDAAVKPTWERNTDDFGNESENLFVQEITFPNEPAAKPAEEAKTDDATETEEEKSEEAKTEGGDSASSETAAPAANSTGELKEFIVYLKHKDRLVACQFLPSQVTEAELVETVKNFIPFLKVVVKQK